MFYEKIVYMWKYAYSLWISCSVAVLFAQKKDTIPALQGSWMGVEVGGIAKDLWCRCGSATDIDIGLVHRKFLLEFSGGIDRRTEQPIREEPRREDEPLSSAVETETEEEITQQIPVGYLNEGYFLRSSIALRLSSAKNLRWLSGLGLAYGYATYKEKMQTRVTSVLYTDRTALQAQEELSIRWWELYFRLQTRLWKNMLVGYRAFVVLDQEILGEQRIKSAYTPGRRILKTQFGISYYITYYLNWTKRIRQ